MQYNLIIARAYATAIFNTSIQHRSLKYWKVLLRKLLQISQIQNVNQFFNIIYPIDVILKIIITTCSDIKIDKYGTNFIKLLILNQRLHLIKYIFHEYMTLYNNHYNIINVEITTTHALDKDQKEKINIILKRRFRKTVNLICFTDPSILYGVILRYHDMVINDCIFIKLHELSNFLIS
ncbi:ATP synthase F1 subunit delta [Buchnera aphidicola (Takecallis taiwana)]|uniref:ATP synthase F1 subunit delta n=1 Tax=Buchnera aphidicola TaxID=9 RepID=UPI0031B6E6C3